MGNSQPLHCWLFALLLSACSWLTSYLLKLNTADSTAVEMEVIVRNVNLGVLIKASIFPAVAGVADSLGDMVLFTVLLYGGLQMLLAAVVIVIGRRKTKSMVVDTSLSNN